MKETDYYSDILNYFLLTLKEHFSNKNFQFWGGTKNIKNTIMEIPDKYDTLRKKLLLEIIPVETDIDIICYNTDNKNYLIIILEVKVDNLTLNHLSQLMGYLNVTGISIGLLINIKYGLSLNFMEIVKIKPKLLDYDVIQDSKRNIKIGLVNWNPKTSLKLRFYGKNPIESIDILLDIIARELNNGIKI